MDISRTRQQPDELFEEGNGKLFRRKIIEKQKEKRKKIFKCQTPEELLVIILIFQTMEGNMVAA